MEESLEIALKLADQIRTEKQSQRARDVKLEKEVQAKQNKIFELEQSSKQLKKDAERQEKMREIFLELEGGFANKLQEFSDAFFKELERKQENILKIGDQCCRTLQREKENQQARIIELEKEITLKVNHIFELERSVKQLEVTAEEREKLQVEILELEKLSCAEKEARIIELEKELHAKDSKLEESNKQLDKDAVEREKLLVEISDLKKMLCATKTENQNQQERVTELEKEKDAEESKKQKTEIVELVRKVASEEVVQNSPPIYQAKTCKEAVSTLSTKASETPSKRPFDKSKGVEPSPKKSKLFDDSSISYSLKELVKKPIVEVLIQKYPEVADEFEGQISCKKELLHQTKTLEANALWITLAAIVMAQSVSKRINKVKELEEEKKSWDAAMEEKEKETIKIMNEKARLEAVILSKDRDISQLKKKLIA